MLGRKLSQKENKAAKKRQYFGYCNLHYLYYIAIY